MARIIRILMAHGITIAGIFSIPWIFSLSKSWLVGFMLFGAIVPVFPTVQTIMLGQRPAGVIPFVKIYSAEYASLMMQLMFILVTAPFIAIVVAGRLVVVLLLAAAISWVIVGLQQLNINIGSKMPLEDIQILLWVTVGLAAMAGGYGLLRKITTKYELEDRYFTIWANQFRMIREFFRE